MLGLGTGDSTMKTLTPIQGKILRHLHREGPLLTSQLVQKVCVGHVAIRRHADGLVELGLAKKVRATRGRGVGRFRPILYKATGESPP